LTQFQTGLRISIACIFRYGRTQKRVACATRSYQPR